MKTKRLLALVLAVLTLCTLTACNKKPEPQTDSESKVEVSRDRWYDEYTDHLILSEEYGELVPYIAKLSSYEYVDIDGGETKIGYMPYYGLCTKDGKIVVDGVYNYITYDDGHYLLATVPEDESPYEDYYIASSNGTTYTELPDGHFYSYEGNGIYSAFDMSEVNVAGYYKTSGELLFETKENNHSLMVLEDNIMVLNVYAKNESYIVNDKLEQISNTYGCVYYSSENRYLVSDLQTGLYGIIDKEENIIIPFEYDFIEFQNGLYMLVKGTEVIIKDENLNLVSSFEISQDEIGSGDLCGVCFCGPSLIKTAHNNYYDIYGHITNYTRIVYDEKSELYTATKDTKTVLLDNKLDEIVTLDGDYGIWTCSNNKKMLMLFLYGGTKESFCIYDIEKKQIVDENVDKISTLFDSSFYYKTNDDGTKTAYEFNTAKEFAKVVNEIYEIETKDGIMYLFESDGCLYTVNENNKTVLKIKAQ